MKTVFRTNADVCKAWAENKQEHGRAGNIHFERQTIYSFNWWPMAKLYPDLKVALFRNESYSPTTGRHLACASWAVRGDYTVIYVDDIDGDHRINIGGFLARLKDTVMQFDRAVFSGRWIINENHRLHEKLVQYCRVFGLKMPVTLGLYLDKEYPFIKNRFLQVPRQPQWDGDDDFTELFLPKWLAKKGMENVEPKDILKTQNAEIRREIIRRLGIDRICYALNAKTIDTQGEYELIILDLKDGRRRPFLKMHNPSVPEIWHVEGVHPCIKTVQDALNYRRYGQNMLECIVPDGLRWRESENYRLNPENWTIKEEWQTSPLFPNVRDWQPEKLT